MSAPVCAKYANSTDIGPNIINTKMSPNAMYFNPMPPVYRKLDDKPPKNTRAKCSILAGLSIDRKVKPDIEAIYKIAPNETTCKRID